MVVVLPRDKTGAVLQMFCASDFPAMSGIKKATKITKNSTA